MDNLEKRFNPEKADKLMAEERYQLLQPEKLIRSLDIQQNDIIADLGAGTGFFTIPLAQMTTNPVYAIDIEPKMLVYLKEHALNHEITHINELESNLNTIPLADSSIDKLVAAFVLHEVADLDKTLQEIARVIKKGGKIMLVEFEATSTPTGPPVDIRIASIDLKRKLEYYSFYRVEIDSINDSNYRIIAEKQ